MNGNSDSSETNYSETNYPEPIAVGENLEQTQGANGDRSHWRQRVQTTIRYLRRFGASTLDVTLLVSAAMVPFSAGWYANQEHIGKFVPLNPLLAIAAEKVAWSLALPPCPQPSGLSANLNSHLSPHLSQPIDAEANQPGLAWCPRPVSPLANLLWSVAIVAPGVLAIGQIYRLGKTGQTLPKRWFKIVVVTHSGSPPGVLRAFWREGISKFAIPGAIAYGIWWWTGATPDLLILAGLTATIWVIDGISACFDSQQRTVHDRLAGTVVGEQAIVEEFDWKTPQNEFRQELPGTLSEPLSSREMGNGMEVDDRNRSILVWIREHQEISLLVGIAIVVMAMLGALIGTQVYVQKQANGRSRQAQENQKFITLVNQFAIDERQGAILALGSLDRPDAGIKMLTDLLGLEDDPQQLETIEQALVSAGPNALPYLHKLNQALKTDLDSLRYGGNEVEQQITALRQRSTQRAIGKILRLYSGEIPNINLNRIDLGQISSEPAQFTLVLEKINLSGIQLRGAILTGASFKGSQFYGSGSDRRFGTFDDTKADLSAAELSDANLSEAFLTSTIMEKIDLSRANLNRANLSNANLIEANLSSAQLIGADLRYANLTNAKLTGANLGTADLYKVELSAGRLAQVTAKAANFRNANLSASDLQGADFSGADLDKANLQNANLTATNLSGANLRDAQLQNANLQDADLTGADLRGATLTGADVRGAIFAQPQPKKTDSFIVKSSDALPIGLLRGVDFSQVQNLDLKQMSYLCTQGAVHLECALDK